MDKQTRLSIGIAIAAVIIIGISVTVYAITKYHKDHPAYATTNTGSQTTPSPKVNPVTPSPGSSTNPSSSSCSPVSEAVSLENTTGCIQFTGYQYTSTSSGSMYLDQSLSPPYGFSAYIPAGTSFGPSLLNEYSGQEINVSGYIQNYKGEPEIEVTSASQIQLAQ